MNNQKKLTKGLSAASLILQVLIFIVGAIFAWLFIRQFLKIDSNSMTSEEIYNEVMKIFSGYLFFVPIIGGIGIAEFIILIILAVKTTSITNRILFIMGIFILIFAFMGCILELSIKSSPSSNQKNPQMPNNSNSTTNIPTY